MRAIALYSLFLLFPGITNLQITFNHRFNFGFPAADLTGIISTDSCYYACGIIADSIAPYRTGNIFVKLDLEGEPVFQKTIKDTQKTYETWNNNFIPLPNGNFANAGYTFQPKMKALLIVYDSDGDTLFTKEYFNPHYPTTEFIQPRGFVSTQDNGFVFVNAIDAPNLPNSDIYVFKTDSVGNMVWDTSFAFVQWEQPQSLIQDTEGNLIIGSMRSNLNMAVENYTNRCQFLKLSSDGILLWQYLTPVETGLWDAANDMVLLEDGSLVIATGEGTEVDWPSVNQIWYDKCVFKLSPNGEIIWKKVSLMFP